MIRRTLFAASALILLVGAGCATTQAARVPPQDSESIRAHAHDADKDLDREEDRHSTEVRKTDDQLIAELVAEAKRIKREGPKRSLTADETVTLRDGTKFPLGIWTQAQFAAQLDGQERALDKELAPIEDAFLRAFRAMEDPNGDPRVFVEALKDFVKAAPRLKPCVRRALALEVLARNELSDQPSLYAPVHETGKLLIERVQTLRRALAVLRTAIDVPDDGAPTVPPQGIQAI